MPTLSDIFAFEKVWPVKASISEMFPLQAKHHPAKRNSFPSFCQGGTIYALMHQNSDYYRRRSGKPAGAVVIAIQLHNSLIGFSYVQIQIQIQIEIIIQVQIQIQVQMQRR